jgi:hypothetical protein
MVSVSAPKVRDLISALSSERLRYERLAEAARGADLEVSKSDSEIGRLEAVIAEKEARIARSSAAVPQEPFAEDTQLSRAQRNKRILALRAAEAHEQLRGSEAEVKRLQSAIKAAWGEFGIQEYERVVLRFEEVVPELRKCILDFTALQVVFGSLPVPTVRVDTAPRPRSGTMAGGYYTGSMLVDTADRVWCIQKQNRPEGAEFHAALCAVRDEVERATAKQQPIPETKAAGEENAHRPGRIQWFGTNPSENGRGEEDAAS